MPYPTRACSLLVMLAALLSTQRSGGGEGGALAGTGAVAAAPTSLGGILQRGTARRGYHLGGDTLCFAPTFGQLGLRDRRPLSACPAPAPGGGGFAAGDAELGRGGAGGGGRGNLAALNLLFKGAMPRSWSVTKTRDQQPKVFKHPKVANQPRCNPQVPSFKSKYCGPPSPKLNRAFLPALTATRTSRIIGVISRVLLSPPQHGDVVDNAPNPKH